MKCYFKIHFFQLIFQICEAPEECKVVVVEGISSLEGKAELFLSDESTITVPAELLQAALATPEEPYVNVEMATVNGTLNLELKTRGGEVLSINKKMI